MCYVASYAGRARFYGYQLPPFPFCFSLMLAPSSLTAFPFFTPSFFIGLSPGLRPLLASQTAPLFGRFLDFLPLAHSVVDRGQPMSIWRMFPVLFPAVLFTRRGRRRGFRGTKYFWGVTAAGHDSAPIVSGASGYLPVVDHYDILFGAKH